MSTTVLRHLSSSKSVESHEHYIYIVLNTLSLNMCLVLKPQQHTHGNSCLEIPHQSASATATATWWKSRLKKYRYLSVCRLSHQRFHHNNKNSTTTRKIANRLDVTIAATILYSLQATRVPLLLARLSVL